MNAQGAITTFTNTVLWKAAVTVVVAAIGWWIMYPFRALAKQLKIAQDKLDSIDQTVNVATMNHLNTIETNTGKTVEILEKLSSSHVEMNGYLKGLTARL